MNISIIRKKLMMIIIQLIDNIVIHCKAPQPKNTHYISLHANKYQLVSVIERQ